MALENREPGGNTITILGGKFCQRVPENTPGAVSRLNKLGKLVHEKFYDSFTAKLIGIKTKDTDYGKNWVFTFKDKDVEYNLQLSYSNSYATAFLKMLPNINLDKEMKIEPSQEEVDGKIKSSLFVKQDGVNIKHAYTKEKPNGMPDMKQITVKSQPVWDDTDRLEFLYTMVQTTIIPKLPKKEVSEVTAPEQALSLDDIEGESSEEEPF